MQERLKHEEAVESNNGVWWSARLRVLPLNDNAAAQKGIKRGADKVSQQCLQCWITPAPGLALGLCHLPTVLPHRSCMCLFSRAHDMNSQDSDLALHWKTSTLQVLLPPSVGEELMRQDAPKNGAQLFEIASSSGHTHAGLIWLALNRSMTAQDASCAASALLVL